MKVTTITIQCDRCLKPVKPDQLVTSEVSVTLASGTRLVARSTANQLEFCALCHGKLVRHLQDFAEVPTT